MKGGLRGKAALVDLGGLDSDEASAPVGEAPGTNTVARARSGVAAITQSIAVHHRVQELEEKLATFEDAKLVVQLDPKRIRQSRWKNRHELSYSTQAFADLKAEIAEAGRNVQPIKVRRVSAKGADQEEFEIVYGRRRLRACLELGLPVFAVVEEMDDQQLFAEMERENRNREDLSPWEQGLMYKDALDSGLFASQRQMAGRLGVPQSMISGALALASLPEELVAAFRSPLDLQYRWAPDLIKALERDAVRVMAEAAQLAKLAERPPSKEVLRRLVEIAVPGNKPGQTSREFRAGGRVVGSLVRDRRGSLGIKVYAGVLAPAAEKKLTDFLEKLLAP